MKNKKVWFVTGCSKGLGHALVNELLEQGYMVSATSRSKQALIEAFGNESEQFLPLSMNLADEESVKTALKKTVLKFGRVDVVVNNAGYTHLATIEEMSDKAVRELFDINVFGLLNVIRATLPIMRKQNSGHIFNVSSLGAYNVGPLSGPYCATKLGAAVVSCRRGGASATFDQLNKYFTMNSMPVVSSQYWNQVHGFTPDDVRQDLEGMQTMRTLANNMAWLLKCIALGKKQGIEMPDTEEKILTNFIR